MKTIWTALATISLASLACTAAQAAYFTFDLVHWNGVGSPPTDPDPIDYVHLFIDDSWGGTFGNGGGTSGIWTYGTGVYLDSGYTDVEIDFYKASAGGGFTIIPFTSYGDVDYDYAMDITGPTMLTKLAGVYSITPGVYNYHLGNKNWARVTIAEAAAPAVPEAAGWAMMVVGFGAIGGALRQRRRTAVSFG